MPSCDLKKKNCQGKVVINSFHTFLPYFDRVKIKNARIIVILEG